MIISEIVKSCDLSYHGIVMNCGQMKHDVYKYMTWYLNECMLIVLCVDSSKGGLALKAILSNGYYEMIDKKYVNLAPPQVGSDR